MESASKKNPARHLAAFCLTAISAVSLARAQEAEAPASPSAPTAIVAPRVIERIPADYPPAALAEAREARVELRVTVAVDGTVSDAEVTQSGGAEFDEAALRAVRAWRFEPARRDGVAIASRIRVPFEFALADVVEEVTTTRPSTTTPEAPPPTEAPGDEAAIDVLVRGEREVRTESRSISDFELDRDVLAAAPRQDGTEVLRAAPGLYVGRAEGPAVANHYMLRGFDADHGQDIEFRVGGIPINARSHIHGQGYADFSFLIADVVREMQVSEGVYDPRQGDFALAGSIDLSLGVVSNERGVRARASYGSFGTFRQLLLFAPHDGDEESFGAIAYSRTNGFGQNRSGQGASAIVQHRFGQGALRYRWISILGTARSDFAGVVRRDDIDAGTVCFSCVYPYPTAEAQNALSTRFLTGFFADYENDAGANGELGVYAGYEDFRIQENFTGYIEQSRTLARVAGLGDLIEQQNRTFSVGLLGRYRTEPFRPFRWARGTIELGTESRLDLVEQAQNLLDAAVRNQTWDRRVDASVRSVDLGFYGDLDWSFGRFVTARAGARADVLSYEVDDRLGNFVPASREADTFIVGFRRTAYGIAAGPRASVRVDPTSFLSIELAYGEGFRSPQARQLEDGERAPFAKVRSADVGVRFDFGDTLELAIGGYLTRLSEDVAFDASEGRLERVGATQRLGAVVHAVTRPVDWLVGSLSMTFVDATLLEPPPPTAEEPDPPYRSGQSLPYVPPVVVRADVGARKDVVSNLRGHALSVNGGAGFSFLSPRPLPYGEHAAPVALLDASAGLTYGGLALSFEVYNLFDARYASVEYNYASDWNPTDGLRPRTPTRHIAAGSPRAFMVSLGVVR